MGGAVFSENLFKSESIILNCLEIVLLSIENWL